MKRNRWVALSVCLACLPASVLASPQSPELTVKAIVQADDDSQKESGQSKEKSADEAKGAKVRNSIRLRLVKNDDEAVADTQDDEHEQESRPLPKVWLGIGLKEVEGDLATYLGSDDGVFVQSVFPDSPAQAAGLQEGDVIIEFQGQRVAGSSELVDLLRAIKPLESSDKAEAKTATYPAVRLSVLRRGKEEKVELTPSERPKNLELQKAAEESDWASIFKFGQPGAVGLNFAKPMTLKSSVAVVVKEDGKETVARIERDGDGPAKIIVTEGDKERELSEAQIDQLPPKVRTAVEEALKVKQFHFHSATDPAGAGDPAKLNPAIAEEIREQLEKAMKQVGKVEPDLKKLRELTQELSKGKVVVIDPEKLQELSKLPDEAKAKLKTFTEEARGFSTMPEQLKKLQKQVDELKQQVEELRAQQKASK